MNKGQQLLKPQDNLDHFGTRVIHFGVYVLCLIQSFPPPPIQPTLNLKKNPVNQLNKKILA